MKRPFIFMILLAMVISVGCLNPTEPNPQPDSAPPVSDLADLFPLTKGSSWQYQGEGNEFASFSREVVFANENKGQIRENNGGTISAAVFEVTDEAITLIFFQGEAYEETDFLDQQPSENIVILKKPLEVGTSWEEQTGNREIVSVDAIVDTPAGQFENCIKVEITGGDSTVIEYFKDGVGMVKREFISGDTRVTSSLESFNVKP